MGGSGSGSHYQWWRSAKKTVVEDCRNIDATRWMREGILKAGVHHYGSWLWSLDGKTQFSVRYEVTTENVAHARLRLSYSWTWGGKGELHTADYQIRLTTTLPRYGGVRWWFVCPLVK